MHRVAVLDDKAVLEQLEALAYTLGLQIRYERLESESGYSPGGLCKVRDRQMIFIHSSAPVREKIRILIQALKRFDLSRVYLKPALRDLLEKTVSKD